MARRPTVQKDADENKGEVATSPLPSAIRLTHPFSFIEEVHNKGVFSWLPGEVVENPETIKMLIERTRLWEPVECQEASAPQV